MLDTGVLYRNLDGKRRRAVTDERKGRSGKGTTVTDREGATAIPGMPPTQGLYDPRF